jgi:hypothetical protein
VFCAFPTREQKFSSGIEKPIKSAPTPKSDPMHRICHSAHQLRARARTRSDHQQPDNRTRLEWRHVIRCARDSAVSSEHVDIIALKRSQASVGCQVNSDYTTRPAHRDPTLYLISHELVRIFVVLRTRHKSFALTPLHWFQRNCKPNMSIKFWVGPYIARTLIVCCLD